MYSYIIANNVHLSSSSTLLYVHRDHIGTIRDGDRVGRGRESERLDRGNRPKKTGETVDR